MGRHPIIIIIVIATRRLVGGRIARIQQPNSEPGLLQKQVPGGAAYPDHDLIARTMF